MPLPYPRDFEVLRAEPDFIEELGWDDEADVLVDWFAERGVTVGRTATEGDPDPNDWRDARYEALLAGR